MKRINIPAILFCLILAAGCSQDEPATENPDNGNATGKQITVTAAMPDTRVDTRLAYEDATNDAGTGKLVVKWKESEEKIGLFNATQGTSSTLTQNATSLSEDGKKTDFTGKLPNNTAGGDILYAYYYNGLDDNYSIDNVKMLNIADIRSNGTLAKIKHAMYAKTTYQGGQEGETNISFSFRPLTAALKLTLEGIPSGVTINKLKLSGTNLFYDISVDLTEELPSYSNGLPMGNKEIENLSLSSADNVFYTGLIPGTLSDGMLITATGSDGSVYSATLPDITIEAGNVYVAKVTLAKNTGDIDMTNMTADESKAAIQAALAAGFTEFKLTGPLAKSGIYGMDNEAPDEGSTFFKNKQITKIDLTGVTDWVAVECGDNLQTAETEIGLPAYAFYDCENLTEVKLPAEVKAIGQSAFNGCKSLKSIDFENVTTIGRRAFMLCTAAATINLPRATTIGSGALGYCRAVTEIELPEATTLSGYNFRQCTALTTLKLPKATKVSGYIVANCSNLTRIEMTAAGNITNTDGSNLFNVFANEDIDPKFAPKACTLVLNMDKKEPDGTGSPLASYEPWAIWANTEFKKIEFR